MGTSRSIYTSCTEPIHRPRKKAPREGTPKALKYLNCYLDGKSNRKEATTRLLGCGTSTANRLLSKSKPYTAGLKVEWVELICAAVGKPTGDILGFRKSKLPKEAIAGWNHAKTFPEAMGMATDCALAICYLASGVYNLSGSFTVSYERDTPREVQISLSPSPELAVYGGHYDLHKLLVSMEAGADGKRRMFLQLVRPVTGGEAKKILTLSFLDKQLQRIHALTKNYATELARESTK